VRKPHDVVLEPDAAAARLQGRLHRQQFAAAGFEAAHLALVLAVVDLQRADLDLHQVEEVFDGLT
jgi:hypothetical protein